MCLGDLPDFYRAHPDLRPSIDPTAAMAAQTVAQFLVGDVASDERTVRLAIAVLDDKGLGTLTGLSLALCAAVEGER